MQLVILLVVQLTAEYKSATTESFSYKKATQQNTNTTLSVTVSLQLSLSWLCRAKHWQTCVES